MEDQRVGVIPYRYRKGRVEVLLVTSKDSGRWIIPKGHVEAHLGPHRSAMLEAFEEAGVEGKLRIAPIGSYRHGSGSGASTVEVYLLSVRRELGAWPERSFRTRKWMSIKDALASVHEEGLTPILHIAAEILQ